MIVKCHPTQPDKGNCPMLAVTAKGRSNMRTREDARIYKRLNVYDLNDGIGDLLMAIDEELDDDDDEEEE